MGMGGNGFGNGGRDCGGLRVGGGKFFEGVRGGLGFWGNVLREDFWGGLGFDLVWGSPTWG